MKYMNEQKNISDGCISNLVKSPIWLSKQTKSPNKIVLPIFLFFDDFEISSPLGGHSGSQKFEALYL